MPGPISEQKLTPQAVEQLQAENAQLHQQLQSLQQQLDWFKRQLFGRKSEKRLIENPDQLDLGRLLGDIPSPGEPPATEQISYTRRKGKQRSDDCVTDSGLRFDDRVPVEVIELSAPQLQGPEADQYEIIDHKITRRLAQRPGSYVVLEYRRPVIRDKRRATLMEVPAPSAVFDNSLADVSFLAGLLVDKFCYHLPLYRQHQRLADAGNRVLCGDFLDVDAAGGAGDDRNPVAQPVDGDPEIDLLRNVERRLNEQALDAEALDLHAQNRRGVLLGLGGVGGDLDDRARYDRAEA
mgnify:CR=1 FL=1